MKKSIAIDLDGVLADIDSAFDEFTDKHFPGKHTEYEQRSLFFDAFLPAYVKNDGFFTQKTLVKSRELVDELIEAQRSGWVDLFILTSIGHFHEPGSDVVHQKKRWLEKNFPELNRIPFVTTTSGATKSIFAHPGCFLIDDHTGNVNKFIDAGGYAEIYSPERFDYVINKLRLFYES